MSIPETIILIEAAERYRCSGRTIMRAIEKGLIVAYKPGRHVLIDLKSADAWFHSTMQRPKTPSRRPRRSARVA
jgi:excisionase family DNA binding protein